MQQFTAIHIQEFATCYDTELMSLGTFLRELRKREWFVLSINDDNFEFNFHLGN